VAAVLLAFFAAAVVSILLTPVVRALAVRFDLLDHAVTARKIHGQPVPRLGGAAIVTGFFCALGLVWLIARPEPAPDRERATAFMAGAALIAVLGIVDDLRGANAWQKFAVQVVAAGVVYRFGFSIEILATPFGQPISLGLLSLPLTVLWLVGVTNAFNLIDGLDGLAGGVALIALGVNCVIAFGRGEWITLILAAALAGAVVGFLRHNLHPASIFMGDTGSMFLGFVLAALALGSHQKSTTAVAILVPITAMGLPLLDTALAIVRRVLGRRHVFQADREHIHHRVLALGLTHRRAVLALYLVSAVFGAAAIALNYANQLATVVITLSLATVVYVLLTRLRYIGAGVERDQGLEFRASEIRRIMEAIPVYEPHAVWQALRSISKVVDADCVRLNLVEIGADDETVTRFYTAGPWHGPEEMFLARFRVSPDGASWVEFGWEQGTPRMDPITEEAVRLFCQDIGGAVGRPRPSHAVTAATASGRLLPLRRR
jgi:UDP-GlcNAc:undecaprenyl-phosphate GlcNAc-1-phosphate transferase